MHTDLSSPMVRGIPNLQKNAVNPAGWCGSAAFAFFVFQYSVLRRDMPDHKPDVIRHTHETRVIGVNAVHGEIVGVGGHAEAEAVHEVDVLVPALPRLPSVLRHSPLQPSVVFFKKKRCLTSPPPYAILCLPRPR